MKTSWFTRRIATKRPNITQRHLLIACRLTELCCGTLLLRDSQDSLFLSLLLQLYNRSVLLNNNTQLAGLHRQPENICQVHTGGEAYLTIFGFALHYTLHSSIRQCRFRVAEFQKRFVGKRFSPAIGQLANPLTSDPPASKPATSRPATRTSPACNPARRPVGAQVERLTGESSDWEWACPYRMLRLRIECNLNSIISRADFGSPIATRSV